ncbi:glycoside hydrolase family 76 protein [Paenibacillus sacheonensis]|uniref:Uncharacterized protein n=1 Tax=Paenibacillus sacheonensis TaxID=742054 RepID=A0A7X4YR11_9BACL|nr:glycoside hydrolase family 76 protein [Paenibacillus sacheonensis]MBM7567129.1 putative alpha-1,6-mannanase (GH76 family) [Paenibacillus sacheonensis]NBC70943.1 hypothetical protein [Paenibacillus sacheonensis]
MSIIGNRLFKLKKTVGKLVLAAAIAAPALIGLSPSPAAAFTNTDADTAMNAFISSYWMSSQNQFAIDTTKSAKEEFWKQALMMEVLEDAYDRTARQGAPSSTYYNYIVSLANSILAQYGNDWTYVATLTDDPMWMTMAFLRAHAITGTAGYLTAAKNTFDGVWTAAYDTTLGGGIWWDYAKTAKNTCNNMPAAIAAVMLSGALSDTSYLTKAQNLYAWEKNRLFLNGRVMDNLHSDNVTIDSWEFTYNQGAFIGAAHYLYKATNTASYLQDAIAAADYSYHHITDTNYVLTYDAEDGVEAGAGFKGIFARYMNLLINQDGQSQYAPWMNLNASTVWNNRRTSDNLTYKDWSVKAPSTTIKSFGSSTGVSQLQNTIPASGSITKSPAPAATTTVNLSSYFNEDAYSTDASPGSFSWSGGSYAYPSEQVGGSVNFEGTPYNFGPTSDGSCNGTVNTECNAVKAVGQTIALPSGKYTEVRILAAATYGSQIAKEIKLNYSTSGSVPNQANIVMADWAASDTTGQKVAKTFTSTHTSAGDNPGTAWMYAYYLRATPNWTLTGITLPNIPNVNIFAITLVSAQQADLTPYYNEDGWASDASAGNNGFGGDAGYGYSSDVLNLSPTYSGIKYTLGTAANNQNNEIKGTGQTIALPPNLYSSIKLLGSSSHGDKTGSFTVNYSDGSTSAISVAMQDWALPGTTANAVQTMPRAHIGGSIGTGSFYVFGYSLTPTAGKTVKSITLPANSDMHVYAVSLVP